VFWVHASNAARFEQSFRDIADRVKIAGRRDSQVNIFKLVHDWLRDCKQRWLLVLDNLDDARFLLDVQARGQGRDADLKSAARPLHEYLPHCERGSIFITTRNKEAARRLVDDRCVLGVEPMDKAEGLAPFEKNLEAQEDIDDVAELAAALEYMPLAIMQATAYIYQRAPRFSVRMYLDEFKKSKRKRLVLLAYDHGQFRRDWAARNSIVSTWQISFEYIQQIRPSAADLLSLMSFFDRQEIPKTLLQYSIKQGDPLRSQKERGDDDCDSYEEDGASQRSVDDNEFESDIVTLLDLHFISVKTNGTNFEMHATVQLAVQS
jgi:hypothetical protein